MGLVAYRLTFAMPIKTDYKYRMPQLANFMHVSPPHLWHEHLQIDHTLRLSRMKLSALRIKGNLYPIEKIPASNHYLCRVNLLLQVEGS